MQPEKTQPGTTPCDKFEARLDQLLDERCEINSDSQLLGHAAECDSCRSLMRSYAVFADLGLLESTPVGDPPGVNLPSQSFEPASSAAYNSVADNFESLETHMVSPATSGHRLSTSGWVGALAAGLLIGVFIRGAASPEAPPPVATSPTPAPQEQLASSNGVFQAVIAMLQKQSQLGRQQNIDDASRTFVASLPVVSPLAGVRTALLGISSSPEALNDPLGSRVLQLRTLWDQMRTQTTAESPATSS